MGISVERGPRESGTHPGGRSVATVFLPVLGQVLQTCFQP